MVIYQLARGYNPREKTSRSPSSGEEVALVESKYIQLRYRQQAKRQTKITKISSHAIQISGNASLAKQSEMCTSKPTPNTSRYSKANTVKKKAKRYIKKISNANAK